LETSTCIYRCKEDFSEHIEGTTAGLVIGDRALEQRKQSAYVYDLGEAWKNMTGKSFMFAAWVSNKKLSAHFIESFNIANQFGLSRLDEVVDTNPMVCMIFTNIIRRISVTHSIRVKKRDLIYFLRK
jgi:predicted solute-binding protein